MRNHQLEETGALTQSPSTRPLPRRNLLLLILLIVLRSQLALPIDHTAAIQDFEDDVVLRSIEVDYADSLAVFLLAGWIDYAVDTTISSAESRRVWVGVFGTWSAGFRR